MIDEWMVRISWDGWSGWDVIYVYRSERGGGEGDGWEGSGYDIDE